MSKLDDDNNLILNDPEQPDSVQQLAISGREVIRQSTVKLIGLARRQILMVMPALPAVWDDDNIAQSLLDFVRSSAKRDVMLLINNLDNQPAYTHQLVNLSQRVSSRIQLKQVNNLLEPPIMVSDYLMIIDQQHLLRIDDMERSSAWFDVHFASRAQQYAASFLLQWPRAKEVKEFKQFHL
ncbi:hypothetical protein ACF3NA_05365 [Alkanindiges sp. WGS2144]|uniref:DUF7931 domain-containing protein n=1 Tax=Alkanindiges sp. WGS2144 TaxID=3366808 RepID=UPI003752ED82